MEKLIDSLYEHIINFDVMPRRIFEPRERLKEIDNEINQLEPATQDFVELIKCNWQKHGFGIGFACAMHLLVECGFNTDKLTERVGRLCDCRKAENKAAGAAQGVEGKQEPQTAPVAAGGVEGQYFGYATSVHFLLKNIEVAADRTCLLAGDLRCLHIDHEAHTRFDMLQDELCKIGQYIIDWRDTYESGKQAETPCGCNDCKSNEVAGGTEA